MSNKQFLSILGMYKYDSSIFDNMQMPYGVDKQTLIDNILLDNAELSLVYTDVDFMKDIIGIWSASELDIWTRLYSAFNEEYNPLWNVDENTTETRNIDRHGTDSKDISGSSQHNSNTTITNNTDLDSTTVNSVKGFNSDTWSEHDQSVLDSSQSDTGSNIGVVTGTETTNEEGNHDENITETFNRRRGGNIGVTMSQQLLEAELNVRPKLNIYKYISNSFKNRFCNMIY